MILDGGNFRAEKWFEWKCRPFKGDDEFIKLRPDGGYAPVKISWVKHYAEEDVYEAVCDDALYALCSLFLENQIDDKIDENNGKWKMRNFFEFKSSPLVFTELKRINAQSKKYQV